MRDYKYSCNYDHPLVAELYDQSETYSDDVFLLKSLLEKYKINNILELFCGTGRITIPLGKEGYTVTGVDIAKSMLNLAKSKIENLTVEENKRFEFRHQDVLEGNFGSGYDLIIIGGNSLYELSSPEMQEETIRLAREALKPEGLLFIDNDDYKGGWEDNNDSGNLFVVFEGTGKNGDFGRLTLETIRFDKETNILHMKRIWYCKASDGEISYTEYLSCKHPVTANAVEQWLDKYNFEIIEKLGDWQGNKYSKESKRAIFLAKKD